jgi:hypothetical protein
MLSLAWTVFALVFILALIITNKKGFRMRALVLRYPEDAALRARFGGAGSPRSERSRNAFGPRGLKVSENSNSLQVFAPGSARRGMAGCWLTYTSRSLAVLEYVFLVTRAACTCKPAPKISVGRPGIESRYSVSNFDTNSSELPDAIAAEVLRSRQIRA